MIIDTMVFAYALLGVKEFREEAVGVLEVADEIEVPDSLRAELANVAWQWARRHGLSVATATEVLRDADALISHVIPGDRIWERALELAIAINHAAYDTMFIAAAELADTKVVTFDRVLMNAFEDRVMSPGEFLRS